MRRRNKRKVAPPVNNNQLVPKNHVPIRIQKVMMVTFRPKS